MDTTPAKAVALEAYRFVATTVKQLVFKKVKQKRRKT